MLYISNINYKFDLSVEEKIIETEDETSQKHTVAHLLNTLSPRPVSYTHLVIPLFWSISMET